MNAIFRANQVLARQIFKLAQAKGKKLDLKIVTAESCTGGLVASALTSIPGASDLYCGSLVSYRNSAKIKWLNISQRLLRGDGAVSRSVAKQMALKALSKTPEAQIAAAITGHLGPNAPRKKDGMIYCAVALRLNATSKVRVIVKKHRLKNFFQKNFSKSPNALHEQAILVARHKRALLASQYLLMMVRSLLKNVGKN